VALIYGVGTVMRGRSGFDPVFGSTSMGSETVAAAFRQAIKDRNVKAIVFRVDSPGGSYVASDTIWHETVRAKRAGKPVIVSMSDLAASGGYLVSMHADRIIAQPGTITGSIGVFGGKMVASGLYDKLGVTWDSIQQGQNAMMYSALRDYSPSEWQRLEASLDRIYADFTTKVAEGRRLPKEKVLQIAKGRVWTGEDAKNLGLVDELGGFQAAIAAAKRAAKIPATEDINLRTFPPRKTLFQAVMERLTGDESDSSEQSLIRALRIVQPIARQLRTRGIVEMPEMDIR
jgi:protease-4